jgi:hypothetical protein
VYESMDTPHINRDGRIYRRQASGTDGESIAEDSRSSVDMLYQKGRIGKAILDNYLRRKRDYFDFSQHQIEYISKPMFLIETIVCPIPLRDLINDLFQEKYRNLLPSSNNELNVNIDSIYYYGPDHFEELDVKGCLSTQYRESCTTADRVSLRGEQYKDVPIILPEHISYSLKETIKSADKILDFSSRHGSSIGKVRVQVKLKGVKSKALYFSSHRTFYMDYRTRGAVSHILEIPILDCAISDLKDVDKIIDRLLTDIKRGFNLPF